MFCDAVKREQSATDSTTADILQTLRRYWGFDALRPLQEQAIRAGLAARDSLVVLPTGGGKSLCYQVPPARGAAAPTSSSRRSSR